VQLSEQQRVVAQILMEAGERGCHSEQFYEAKMPTFSQRIGELRASGWVIRAEPEKFANGAVGRRYWFVSKPPMFPVDDIEGEPQEHRLVREQLAMLSEAAFTPAPRKHWEDEAA